MFKQFSSDKKEILSKEALRDSEAKNPEWKEVASMQAVLKALYSNEFPINFTEFKRVVDLTPRVRGQRIAWVRSLSLESVLAKELKVGDLFNPLKGIKEMSDLEIEKACAKFSMYLPDLLKASREQLKVTPSLSIPEVVSQSSELAYSDEGDDIGKLITHIQRFYMLYWSFADVQNHLRQKANRLMETKTEVFITNLFNKYGVTTMVNGKGVKLISNAGFQTAMKELGVILTPELAASRIKMFDIDESGGLDLQAFYQAIKEDPSPLALWAGNLHLSELLAACLPIADTGDGNDELRKLVSLSKSSIKAAVETFTACLLERVLPESLASLEERIRLQDEKAKQVSTGVANKFTVFKMEAGTVKDTQKSLTDRIGALTRHERNIDALTCVSAFAASC